jgi:hypothetical protein
MKRITVENLTNWLFNIKRRVQISGEFDAHAFSVDLKLP